MSFLFVALPGTTRVRNEAVDGAMGEALGASAVAATSVRSDGVLHRGAHLHDRRDLRPGPGVVVLPWTSREALFERLVRLDLLAAVREAFVAVGTSRPVELTRVEGELIGAIGQWSPRSPLS